MARRKKSKFTAGVCQICGSPFDAGFVREPVFWGIHTGEVCFACYCVPKGDRSEGAIKQINTIEEMVEYGWHKKEAAFYIKSFRRYFKIKK